MKITQNLIDDLCDTASKSVCRHKHASAIVYGKSYTIASNEKCTGIAAHAEFAAITKFLGYHGLHKDRSKQWLLRGLLHENS